MDVPKDKLQIDYEVIVISQSNTIRDLRKRIIDSRKTKEFRMWKLVKTNMPFKEYYQSFVNQHKQNQRIEVSGEILNFANQKIGSLGFDENHILVIEHMINGNTNFEFEAIQVLDMNLNEETVISSIMSVNQEYSHREDHSYRPSHSYHNSSNEEKGV
jgi:hypothetical protein